MTADDLEMLARLLAALAAGALIGYERSYHGRPAGFRTHALVCTASSLLMLITVYESHWVTGVAVGRVQLDPTRMAQGIMTGIGFLGAGVIIREGFSVRGLTTAASIWITAAIGILAGIGFYFPLVISAVLTLGVLSFFRWIEARMPSQAYYHFDVRFARAVPMSERQVRELVESHGFSIANFSYRLEGEGRIRRHTMVIRSADRSAAGRLSVTLEGMEPVIEFRIAPTGD
ncbi:MAG TPA: MgtC/SapB family protein [Burkholderiales bacterium]|jgi:putative Mg2+ transporter-C (MgtC) family protein|nr:MgtC/SapB family protein [Burkholderiales bacterium]